MENILNNTGIIVNPADIPSFGNAGQVYNADIFGGFNVSSEKNNILFAFRRGDSGVTNSDALTNLTEAGKIGSTASAGMMTAHRIWYRVSRRRGRSSMKWR